MEREGCEKIQLGTRLKRRSIHRALFKTSAKRMDKLYNILRIRKKRIMDKTTYKGNDKILNSKMTTLDRKFLRKKNQERRIRE